MSDVLRELVLPRLDAVKPSGGGFVARCPAHEDHRASLTVSRGDRQPVVTHCHAGCDPEDIVRALGLDWADLSEPREHDDPLRVPDVVYDYTDEHGALLFQVVRKPGKQFRQRRPDGGGGWVWKLDGVRRVLYRLPAVIDAVAEGREIWCVEGERDVNTLVKRGVDATCNPQGAGKWRPEFAEPLRDAVVTVVADRDEPGRAHARTVRDTLAGVATFVRIVEPAAGKDITDHLDAGFELDQVTVTWEQDPPAAPELAPDLWEFIKGSDEYHWLMPGYLERGDRLIITGLEGLGKTMLVRQIGVMAACGLDPFRPLTREAYNPATVLVVDCENPERLSRRRFRVLAEASLTAQRRVPAGGVRVIHHPAGLDLTRGPHAEYLMERVTAHAPDILIIGPLYKLHNTNINDEQAARQVAMALDAARAVNDSALIIEAHSGLAQNGDGQRELRPVGSSLFLRWPELGFGIRPKRVKDGDRTVTDPRHVEVRPWRGSREERDWPDELEWGPRGAWPWQVPIGQTPML